MTNTFTALISPYSTARFFAKHWAKRAVFIPGENPHKFRHLFGWEPLDRLLTYHQIEYPSLRFARDGKTLPAAPGDRWPDRLREGATLIVDSVHDRVPELSELVANIRQEIGYRSQINLYCSPKAQRGFDCHYDGHEVLILQIAGRKEWAIFPETVVAPTAEMRSADCVPPDVPPYLQCVLNPGDVLYIPRGHWHYAIAADAPEFDRTDPDSPESEATAPEPPIPSLHLTLGIDCQTGLDWVSWIREELQDDPNWRMNLPPIPDGDRQQAASELETLRDRLISWLQTPAAIDRYLDRLDAHGRSPLPFSLLDRLGCQIFENGLETRFVRPGNHTARIASLGDRQIRVTIASKQATIAGLEVDVVEKLFRSEGFTLLDLADWSPALDLDADVVPLLTRLVKQGLLRVDRRVSRPIADEC